LHGKIRLWGGKRRKRKEDLNLGDVEQGMRKQQKGRQYEER